MCGTIVIHMPLTTNGIPVVELNKVLQHIVPDLRRAIAEGIVQGQKLIPLNEHMVHNKPRIHASVSWTYQIHSAHSPATSQGT